MDTRLFLNTSYSSIPLCANMTNNPNVQSSRNRTGTSNRSHRDMNSSRSDSLGAWHTSLFKKYVLLCLICGGVSLLLGCFLIVVHFLFRSHTSSLQYLETIPTYIPAVMLILNGLIVMCLARRKSRHLYLIKLAGGCCIISALLCVVITVTTTVVHMNRLQTLTACKYNPDAHTCSCSLAVGSSDTSEADVAANQLTFQNLSDCSVIHGVLFTCLRALFGLSVFGILICIFSSMLVYQLLSHERKKVYLEQLEARRRFQHQNRRLQTHLPLPPMATHLLHHSQRHNALCNCIDDNFYPIGWPPPPPLWDVLDSRSFYRNFEDEPLSNNDTLVSNRVYSWTNWITWPWNNNSDNSANARNTNSGSNSSGNAGFLSRLFRRRPANTSNENPRNNASSLHPSWRTGPSVLTPPHVFIPRLSSGGLTTLPVHVTRYRNTSQHPFNTRNRAAIDGHSTRRTRSNDGIFHHLHLAPHPGVGFANHTLPPPPHFALWGPPPPYTCSQPTSVDGLNSLCNNLERRSLGNRRQSSVQSNSSAESKTSTPISERRMHCNAFSAQGITLTISGNENVMVPTSKSSCIVEVHVPYEENQNNMQESLLNTNYQKLNDNFNTMPSVKRSEHLQSFNPFHSLSNIPVQTCDGIASHIDAQATIISTEYPKFTTIQNVYCSKSPLESFSSPSISQSASTQASSGSELTTESSTQTPSYPVDPPTDYKSTLIVASNTQSDPITEPEKEQNQSKLSASAKLNSAHSMPNLSCVVPVSHSNSSTRHSQPHFWDLHRVPSSGNTSTSQDFVDFEFELDEEPIKFMPENSQDNTESPSSSSSKKNSSTSASTSTAGIIQPPIPFVNLKNSQSTESVTSLNEKKADNIVITIKSIQV